MHPRHCEPTVGAKRRPMTGSGSNPLPQQERMDCFVAALLAMTVENILGLSLFDLFAQHFKFQPFVLGLLQVPSALS